MATEDKAEVVEEIIASEKPPVEEVPEDEATEEETEEPTKSETQKEIDTLTAQKDHWRKKAREGEDTISKLKEGKEEPADAEFRPRVEFLLKNRDFDEKEFEHIAAVAQRKAGKVDLESLGEAKESEKEYISFLRKKVENQRKSPGSTTATGVAKVQKSPEEISKMDSAQHQKYEQQMMAAENQGI